MAFKRFVVFVVLVVVLVAGGLLYAVVSGNSLNARSVKLIESLRADVDRLSGELEGAQGRVVELEGIAVELRERSDKVTAELERSKKIAGDLKSDNLRLEFELGRSQKIVEGFRAENSRLGEALERSLAGTGSITESHTLLGDSIDRAISILDKLEEGLR